MREVVESGLSQEEEQKALTKIEEEAKSIEEQALAEMQEFGDTMVDVAQLQNRSIDIGDAIKESVEKIRDMINEAIVDAMPLIVASLETIAEVIEDIWSYIKTWMDPQFSEEQQKALAEEFGKARAGTGEDVTRVIAESQARVRTLREEEASASALGSAADVTARFIAGASEAWWETMRTGRLTTAPVEESLARSATATRSRRIAAEARQQAQTSAEQGTLSTRATGIYESFGQRTEQMAEGGWTSRERQFRREIDMMMAFLGATTETGTTAEREEAFRQSQALIDAIDESRRNRATGPTNQDRGTTRPTTDARGTR